MDDGLFVDAIFDLSGFGFFDGFFDVVRDSAGFGVWHEAFWTKHTSVFSELWHESRGGDKDVKSDFAFFETFQERFVFGDVGAGFSGFFGDIKRSKDGDADGLAVSVWKNDGRANVLVGLAWVDPEADMSLDGGIEFGRVGFYREVKSFGESINFVFLEKLGLFAVVFAAAFDKWASDRFSAFGFSFGLGFFGGALGFAGLALFFGLDFCDVFFGLDRKSVV